MAYGASTLDQSNTTEGTEFGVKTGTDNWAIGQSFTCGTTGALDKVIFKLKKYDNPVVTGTATCYLYADDGTSPTGSILSTSTGVDVSTLSATGAEATFQFPGTYRITIGVKYWTVLGVSYAQSNANYITAIDKASNDYASGNKNRMQSDNTWKADQGTNDMYFKEYILPFLGDAAFIFNMI